MVPVPRQVARLRQHHRDQLAENRVTAASRWQQSCHAYNVHIEPSPSARDGLAQVQDALVPVEANLLRCPARALHISVAWLLAVHVEYDEPKESIWKRHGRGWVEELATIAGEHAPFELRYRWLVVTDTAIIAVAEPTGPVRRLRDDIVARLVLPEQTKNRAELVHTTLFRFRAALSDAHGLMKAADSVEFDVATTAEDLTVSEELVFPSLVTSTKARLSLGG